MQKVLRIYKTQLKITALYIKNNAREKSLSGMVFNH